MLLLGRGLLPGRESDRKADNGIETCFLSEVTVSGTYPHIDGPLKGIADFQREGVRVRGVKRGSQIERGNLETFVLQKEDSVIVETTTSELLTFAEQAGLRVGLRRSLDLDPDVKLPMLVRATPKGVQRGFRDIDADGTRPLSYQRDVSTVSATALPYAARLDGCLKRQGIRSSIRLCRWPSRIAHSVAAL